MKYHPSILEIQKYSKNKIFPFQEVSVGKIEKEILKLDKSNASETIYIPTRIIKENAAILAEFLCTSINSVIESASLPSSLKLAYITPLHKKEKRYERKL